MLVTYIYFCYGHYCSMKLEENFLIAEMYYNNFVVKNEVPACWKFRPFFTVLSVQGQSNTVLL